MNIKSYFKIIIVAVLILPSVTAIGKSITGRGISFCGLGSSEEQTEKYSVSRAGAGAVGFYEQHWGLYGLRRQVQFCTGSKTIIPAYQEFDSSGTEVLPFDYEGTFLNFEIFPVISEPCRWG